MRRFPVQLLLLLLSLVLFLLLQQPVQVQAASGGTCAGCVVLVGLIERLALHHSVTLKQAANVICSNFKDGLLRDVCNGLLDTVILSQIEADFRAGKSPDFSCQEGGLASLGLCTDFGQCQLYKQWPPRGGEFTVQDIQQLYSEAADSELLSRQQSLEVARHFAVLARSFPHLLSGLQENWSVEDVFSVTGDITKHLPVVDLDDDGFSTFQQLRGSDWRGKDCNDLVNNVYPGRKQTSSGPDVDHNCNGIVGSDHRGNSYEDLFCKNSSPRGVAILGDSAAAHFSLPPEYLDAKRINSSTYSDLIRLATNELDWPHCSWVTGHTDSASQQLRDCPPSKLPFKSIYQRMVERNRCNHRDYQNIGVNGARSTSMAPPGIVESYRRSKQDQPSIVIHGLIGNDVCNSRHNFDSMTKPEVFEAKVLETLRYLDERLAPGSHVIFFPLADGRVLYETMSRRVHPAGLPYTDFYDYLNCLQTSPCWGWMNSDQSVRDRTTAHADRLNKMYTKIMREHTFTNFKMYYRDFDWRQEFLDWERRGNSAADLIELTDGFHPSTTANQLIANHVWEWLEREHPEVIGPVNPHNADIQRIFGNQGGH